MRQDHWVNEITPDIIAGFLRRHRSGDAGRILTRYAEHKKFHDILSEEIGIELLKDLFGLMDELIEKVIDETATPQDLADYRAFRRLADRWQKRLKTYYKLHEVIVKEKKDAI